MNLEPRSQKFHPRATIAWKCQNRKDAYDLLGYIIKPDISRNPMELYTLDFTLQQVLNAHCANGLSGSSRDTRSLIYESD